SAALRRFRDAGLLSQHGRGSATWYKPTAALLADHAMSASAGRGLSTNPDVLSTNQELLSTNPGPLPANQDDGPRRALLDELPGALAARVGGLGRRQPPGEVEQLIADLCAFRAWRAEELALLLGRNPRYVKNDYLRPLRREGRVEMTRPDVPNDPDQAYRAVPKPEAH